MNAIFKSLPAGFRKSVCCAGIAAFITDEGNCVFSIFLICALIVTAPAVNKSIISIFFKSLILSCKNSFVKKV
ncbi:MAG TPA: hypothetical protein VFS36_09825 [Chitinophagaceae bacterium]|nr:hypothetical protein [Chitinophagaceae bacterium]